MPVKQEGKSSAGIHYRKEEGHREFKWDDTKCVLDLAKPFTVWVTPHTMRVYQAGVKRPDSLFYLVQRTSNAEGGALDSDADRPCMIGFKFVDVLVSYRPLPLTERNAMERGASVPVAAARGQSVAHALDSADLTPAALMAKLKLLALDSARAEAKK